MTENTKIFSPPMACHGTSATDSISINNCTMFVPFPKGMVLQNTLHPRLQQCYYGFMGTLVTVDFIYPLRVTIILYFRRDHKIEVGEYVAVRLY